MLCEGFSGVTTRVRVLVSKRYCRCGSGTQNKSRHATMDTDNITSSRLITVNSGGGVAFSDRYARAIRFRKH